MKNLVLKESRSMPSHLDSAGRPIVVVTGIGVVTSLGVGKTDNWTKLTAGQSGIRNITRFATEGLKTRFAGTVDFVPADPLSAPELSERFAGLAAEEAVAESGIGSAGDLGAAISPALGLLTLICCAATAAACAAANRAAA